MITKSTHRSSFNAVAMAAVLGLLGAAQALAVDGLDGKRSVTVSFRDLNLSTIEGATALYLRIKRAANHVCYVPEGWEEAFRSCRQAAIGDAVAKVNSPLLTAVSGGKKKESTATAMLDK
jgi:UrcA family protein